MCKTTKKNNKKTEDLQLKFQQEENTLLWGGGIPPHNNGEVFPIITHFSNFLSTKM